MKELVFVGDLHGKIGPFRDIVRRVDVNTPIIQVGDVGFGFLPILPFPKNVHLIRGNHDSPDEARRHPNYLGDFGFSEELGIFYVSGAYSIDYKWRQEGVSWWRQEELSGYQFDQALQLYKRVKPEIVVSHDCPLSARSHIFNITHHDEVSATNKALDEMLLLHRPKVWVFGHHHQTVGVNIFGVQFQCLAELHHKELSEIIAHDD